MFLTKIVRGVSKEKRNPYTMLVLLSDDLTSVKTEFPSRQLAEKGIPEDLVSTPDQMIPIKVTSDPFQGVVAIEEA